MDYVGEKEIRAIATRFVEKNRHGGVKMLVNASGKSRPTITRFLAGESVEKDTLIAIQNGLSDLGCSLESLDTEGSVADFKSRFDLLADEMATLSAVFRSDEYSPEEKTRKLEFFVRDVGIGLGIIPESPKE